MYTPEQLRIAFEDIAKGYGWPLDMGEVAYLSSETEKLWQGFRWGVNCDVTLKAAQGGVSEAMVAELIAAGDFLAMNGTDGMVRRWEKAKAALSAEPAAQGESLCQRNPAPNAAPAVGVTSTQRIVYLSPEGTAPPAQPAERVPEGYALVPAEAVDTDAFMVLHEYQQPGRTRKDAYRIAIRKLSERASEMLDASPAPSEGGKGAEG